MRDHYVAALAALTLLFSPALSSAGDAKLQNDGSLTWQAGVDGVEIEWNPDGSIRRIYSKYATPVEVGDRRGIAKAQIIAEEKAKANIVRFMSQGVAASRIVAEIQVDVNKATQERQKGSATLRKVDERTLTESLTEITGSFAAGTLRGVIVLEKGYDDKAGEAWVAVGVSEKTIRASRGIENMTRNSAPEGAREVPGRLGQPGEVRRSRQSDW